MLAVIQKKLLNKPFFSDSYQAFAHTAYSFNVSGIKIFQRTSITGRGLCQRKVVVAVLSSAH